MWSKILELYDGYIGTGMMSGLFLVALIYLLIVEKNKNMRVVFVYMPLLTLLLYFNPLFARVVNYFTGEEVYYRFLWLVPMVPVLAYCAIKIVVESKEELKLPVGLVIGIIFVLSGSLVYKSSHFQKAENIYHVPQTVVDLCDTICSEDEVIMAVFPKEFLQYVRQYNAYIRMPYGREMTVPVWVENYNHNSYLYEHIENATLLDVSEICWEAREWACRYLIISEQKQLDESFLDYGYEIVDVIDGYVIYKCFHGWE